MAKLIFNEIQFADIKAYMDKVGASDADKAAFKEAMYQPVWETEKVYLKDENGNFITYNPTDKDGNVKISKKTGLPEVRKRLEQVVKKDANGENIQKKDKDGNLMYKKDLIEAKKWFRKTYPDAVEANKEEKKNAGDIFDGWF